MAAAMECEHESSALPAEAAVDISCRDLDSVPEELARRGDSVRVSLRSFSLGRHCLVCHRQALNMSRNKYRKLPRWFCGALSRLQHLNLADNKLRRLPRGKDFWLRALHTYLRVSADFGKLQNLEVLDVSSSIAQCYNQLKVSLVFSCGSVFTTHFASRYLTELLICPCCVYCDVRTMPWKSYQKILERCAPWSNLILGM